ncbi:polysaccharide pyruvyl transferase family protein [Campylobacter coli]|nr:polysaccharide pyruvyl transferase family protein [Campylobacter coli]
MFFKKMRILRWKILSFIYKKEHYRYKIYMYNHQNKDYILKKYSHFIGRKFSDFGMKTWSDKVREYCLFKYLYIPGIKTYNLGDYIQTIATRNAIDSFDKNVDFQFYDRDSFNFYDKKESICIMQGWFADDYNFLPNERIFPIYIGTHFTKKMQEYFDILNLDFKGFEIGCRDLSTLEYFNKKGANAYFSRCLTLTLPKREINSRQTSIFLVNLNDEIITFLPEYIKKEGIVINQKSIKIQDRILKNEWQKCYKEAQDILGKYALEAKLVVTTALHCAAPCIALGIPVVLIQENDNQEDRFSALRGILKAYSLDDLKNNRINFVPKSLDIENLKEMMISNLKLTLKKNTLNLSKNEEKELDDIRRKIACFRII